MTERRDQATPATDLPGWRILPPGSIPWSTTARAMLRDPSTHPRRIDREGTGDQPAAT